MREDPISAARLTWLAALWVLHAHPTAETRAAFQIAESNYCNAYRQFGPPAARAIAQKRSIRIQQVFSNFHRNVA